MKNLSPNEIEEIQSFGSQMKFQRLLALAAFFATVGIIILGLLWTPITGPWAQQRVGLANLRQAKQERKIIVEKARGELLAAEDQAAAIETMGKAARDFPEYRTQIFIQALAEALADGTISEIVYLPVEANMPMTEAGARFQ